MSSVSNDEQEYRRPSFPELGAAPPLGGMGSPRFGNGRPMAGIFQGGYFHAWVVNAAPGCHSTRCVYVYMRIAVQYVSCHTVCHCYCTWQPLSSDTQTRSRPNPLPPVCPTHCCSHTAVATQLHVRSTCTSQTRSIWVRRRGVRVTNRWRLPILKKLYEEDEGDSPIGWYSVLLIYGRCHVSQAKERRYLFRVRSLGRGSCSLPLLHVNGTP